ncbi:ATP-binding protein [Pseudonocardia asaccharolytica]|uniref:Anti-sigma factor n=1 Tax=Pseudonocardia asaccharolytica DSM 44247 = NBRC 16224 TaxID=1123024 RepID=A0A511D1P9_9PSEU|nr:ATP-binding protein [Pseudonocardia asaccharolytica]GEL18701.1 anti-sigma factor [Pseudonocardia asaccharolytica DSM 44247 = NBRC 16224]
MPDKDPAGSATVADGSSTVEIRTVATAALIPTIRAVASDLAARADFDLDAISDLRMAVDEACATLVDVAAPGSGLRCTFRVLPERIQVSAEVEAAAADTIVATDTFGWRVLETLADGVSVQHSASADGRATVGIVLGKSSGAPTL